MDCVGNPPWKMKMPQDILHYLENLKRLKVADFRGKPLPSKVQEQMAAICDAYVAGTPQLRSEMRSLVTFEISFVFFMFSRLSAEQAVRENSEICLIRGLAALSVEDCSFDSRDSTIQVSLLFHSAKKIGIEVSVLFSRIISISGQRGAKLLKDFLSRDANLQSIS